MAQIIATPTVLLIDNSKIELEERVELTIGT